MGLRIDDETVLVSATRKGFEVLADGRDVDGVVVGEAHLPLGLAAGLLTVDDGPVVEGDADAVRAVFARVNARNGIRVRHRRSAVPDRPSALRDWSGESGYMRLPLVVMVLFLAAYNTSPGPGPDKGTKVETIVAVVDGKPPSFHAAPPIDDNTIDCDLCDDQPRCDDDGRSAGAGRRRRIPMCAGGEA